jgi:hypothetical protein
MQGRKLNAPIGHPIQCLVTVMLWMKGKIGLETHSSSSNE